MEEVRREQDTIISNIKERTEKLSKIQEKHKEECTKAFNNRVLSISKLCNTEASIRELDEAAEALREQAEEMIKRAESITNRANAIRKELQDQIISIDQNYNKEVMLIDQVYSRELSDLHKQYEYYINGENRLLDAIFNTKNQAE